MDLNAITMMRATTAADVLAWPDTLPMGGWAFRGQSRTFGGLMPSFAREFPPNAPARVVANIEDRLIGEFRESYSRTHNPSSGLPHPNMLQGGANVLALSVMQHYGARTRLLDWTEDYEVALYFACSGDPDTDAELWAYERGSLTAAQAPNLPSGFTSSTASSVDDVIYKRAQPSVIVEYDERSISPRMISQQGFHTVCTSPLGNHAEMLFDCLCAPGAVYPVANPLRRIVIESAVKSKLLRYFAQDGRISAATLFPDMEGLGRYLRAQMDVYRSMLF